MPKYPTEKSVGEKHGTDQHIQNGEESDQNPYSTSQKKTCYKDRKIIEVEDQRDFFNKVCSNEGNDKDDTDKDLLKMFHDEQFHTFHDFSPRLFLLRNKMVRTNLKVTFLFSEYLSYMSKGVSVKKLNSTKLPLDL
jgi:hypothetical protein